MPDEIFHLAALADENPVQSFRVNVLGTTLVLDAVRRVRPGCAVLVVGSAAEYGVRALDAPPLSEDDPCLPSSIYGVSKLASTLTAQLYARRHGLRTVVVRLFNLVGAGLRPSLLVGALVERANDAIDAGATSIRIGNLDARRDFMAVGDAVDGCIAAIRNGRPGEIYNLCSGKGVAVESVARAVIAATGRPLQLAFDSALDRGADSSVGSWRKAHDQFGFSPSRPLTEAIQQAWNFARSRRDTYASAR